MDVQPRPGESTTTLASPVSTVVHTPPPRPRPETSPASVEKAPLPSIGNKRKILEALEQECQYLEALVLKRRQLLASRAVEAARAVAHPHLPPGNSS